MSGEGDDDTCRECGAETDALGRALPPPQPDGYRNPAVAVDAVCTRASVSGIEVLMITRDLPPGNGLLALPGGFVEYGEDPELAVLRELVEETGCTGTLGEILCVRGDPQRDPRKHIVSIVYHVDVEPQAALQAGDDAAAADWFLLAELLESPERVAFDHREILAILVAGAIS
jgi:8-oxo-dGTP diphosphatase